MRCPFTLDQLFSYGYKNVCDCFFDLCDDYKKRAILESILYKGEYNSFVISSNILNKDNPELEIKRRVSMAYLFLTNPNTFKTISENNINLFHGTTSNALPNILKYGLNSLYISKKEGIEVNTGEEWSRLGEVRNFVSFTDILDIAKGYSCCNNKEKLYFEVIIGTTVDDIYDAGKCTVMSDIPEVGVFNRLPLGNIKAIFVPSDKVNFVKKMLNNNILILPIDDYKDFYYYSNNELINYLKNHVITTNKQKQFSLIEIKKVVQHIILKFKDNIIKNKIGYDEFENERKIR